MSEGAQVVVHTAGANESGPPTVADFDGDGFAEVGTASSTAYVVFDFQCTGTRCPRSASASGFDGWSRTTIVPAGRRVRACSISRAMARLKWCTRTRTASGFSTARTARSSTKTLRTAATRAWRCRSSSMSTTMESRRSWSRNRTSDRRRGGIEIWEDADNNWVRTRRIWNQHTYSVTNVTEDGQIPRVPEHQLDALSAQQLPAERSAGRSVRCAGLRSARDLQTRLRRGQFTFAVVVGNDGSLSVPPGILTHVVVTTDDARVFDLGAVATTDWLLPGQSEQLEVVFDGSSGPQVPEHSGLGDRRLRRNGRTRVQRV